ncbi:MAG: calcium/sodium antiporter [Treponema sp.]|nr:calcium/sodium antiporter [Treponema sp.]
MTIFFAAVLFFAGTILIIKGGDIFIDAASWVSDVTGISRAVIGATIVSLATTSPEYFVSLIATIKGHNDLSIGNAVGSLTANIGIAFALLAIFTPGIIKDKLFGVKSIIMTVSTIILLLFCLNGTLSVIEGFVLLLLFGVSTFINIRYSKDSEDDRKNKQTNPRDITVNVIKFIGGAAAIVYGSNLIVDNAQVIASAMGVSEAVIGLTVVAIGTSLPEVVTSIAAIIKKQNALSIGNIIGANILDATLILSTGAFISSGNLTVSQSTVKTDLPVSILLMVMSTVPTVIGKKIYRWQGIMIAVVYAAYLLFVAVYS